MRSKAPGVRLNQAILLLAGALFLAFVVAPEQDRFYWTPLTIGLACLGAAVAGGRGGGYWSVGSALTGWGAAVVLIGAAQPDLDASGTYLAGAGLGSIGGLLLQRAGYAVSPMGLAATIAIGGLLLALTTQAGGFLDEARTYAAAMGVVALVNVVLAIVARPPTESPATPSVPEDAHLDQEVSYDTARD